MCHFKASQKPEGSAKRFFECSVNKDCPYSVQKIYLEKPNQAPTWPMSVVCDIEDYPRGYAVALEEAWKTGAVTNMNITPIYTEFVCYKI